jgi:hypothetical protein
MFNFGVLQQGMLSGSPLLIKSIRVVTSVVVLLARQLIEFSTSASNSSSVPSASEPEWPAPSLRLAFVGVVKAGGGGASSSSSDS